MGVKQEQRWITGEELGERRRELLKAGFDDDSAQMRPLWERVRERDDYLWEKYAAPLIPTHYGQWAAVSPDGEIIIGKTSSEVGGSATDRFGAGSFVLGRLAEFRGINISRW